MAIFAGAIAGIGTAFRAGTIKAASKIGLAQTDKQILSQEILRMGGAQTRPRLTPTGSRVASLAAAGAAWEAYGHTKRAAGKKQRKHLQ